MYYKVNRLLSFATAVALFVTTSCNKSETNLPTDPTEKVKVSILLDGISQSFEPMSKAAVTLPDTLRLRVTLNVFNNDGNVVYSDEKLLTESGGSIPVEFMIEKGLYDIAFWADYVVYKNNAVSEQAYSFTTLQEITPDADFNGDAFSLILREIDVNDDMTLTEGTSLTRAVSMLRIESTDNVPEAAKQVRYTLSKTTTSLNLLTGLPTISESPVSYENALTAGSPIDISRYLLPCDKFTCTIEALGESGEPIVAYEMENVATEPNVKTVLKGNFFSDGVSTSLTLGMETAWNADRNYVITPNAQPSGPNINDQEIVFPDEAFKNFCLANFDADGNGIIQYKEIKNVRDINIRSAKDYPIKTFEGIEYFTSLTTFYYNDTSVSGAHITIEHFDVSHNSSLRTLTIKNATIPNQDFEKNTVLTSIRLEKVDIDAINLNLGIADITLTNVTIDKLDLSNRPNLASVNINTCPLNSINLTNSGALNTLICESCNLTTLDISTNPNIYILECNNNQLSSLDISNLSNLENFECSNNNISTIDLYNNRKLSYAYCYDNPLKTIYVWQGYSFRLQYTSDAEIVTQPL